MSQDERLNARAGYPLGVLCVREVIDERLHDAGLAYRSAFFAYRGVMGFPALGIAAGIPNGGVEPSPEVIARLRERFLEADQLLAKRGIGIRALVSNVVIADVMPEPYQVSDLVIGLTALASYFRIAERKEAAQQGHGWRERHRSLAGEGPYEEKGESKKVAHQG